MPLSSLEPWVRTDEPLLWLHSAGHERIHSSAYYFDANRRIDPPHICLQLTISGGGFYQDAAGRRVLRPGMAFLHTIPGTFEYGYAPEVGGMYQQVWVATSGPQAQLWADRIINSFGHVLDFGTANPVEPLMLAIVRLNAGGGQDRYLHSSQLYQLFMTILSVLNQSRVHGPRMTAAVTQIVSNAADANFNVADLSRLLDCSREHLARQFRAATGVSPSEFLMQHRLRLVARELRANDDKLQNIARRCGFSGANYLCRAFRQGMGLTPAQYRRNPNDALPIGRRSRPQPLAGRDGSR
ncbi:MAG: AraC family transcriptional regulator [Phycisphaerales bacterium]|jgi:AraC-like DNA-binding protein|nr:AraC family transcriptional regulator [Phycisphaerales bacterium]